MLPGELEITGIKAKPRKIVSSYNWQQKKIKMSISTENWFEQTNKYKYLELMCIVTRKDVTNLKEIHGVLKGSGLWVDVKRFVKSNKQFNPAGLFQLFGSFSDQTAEDVHDCLIGWIYDNYNSEKGWLKMAVLHKKINLNDWIEQMPLNMTHGDNIALYLLCRMYNKHAYVHTAKYGWSTLPFKIDTPFIETTVKCDIELVLLHCWLFGEVLKIHRSRLPNKSRNTQNVPDADHSFHIASSKSESNSENPVIPRKANSQIVLPGNVAEDHVPGKIMWCTVSIECLGDPMVRNVMEPTIKLSQDVSTTDSKHGYAMRS